VDASVEELRGTDLLPFQRAIDAGAPVVMLNHLAYAALDPELPASVSPGAYALLREMGFEGVAMTDSLGMGAINLRWDFPEAAVRAIEAGADAALATDGNQAVRMRDALVEAVRSGRMPEERLSEAAARVTALAGGDPEEMSCLDLTLPSLVVPADAGAAPYRRRPRPAEPARRPPPPPHPGTRAFAPPGADGSAALLATPAQATKIFGTSRALECSTSPEDLERRSTRVFLVTGERR
jgi:hypothetical protein